MPEKNKPTSATTPQPNTAAFTQFRVAPTVVRQPPAKPNNTSTDRQAASPKQPIELLCQIAVEFNRNFTYNALVLHAREQDSGKVTFLFYPDTPKKIPSAETTSSISNEILDNQLVELAKQSPNHAGKTPAILEYDIGDNRLTANTRGLPQDQAQTALVAGLQLVTNTCHQQSNQPVTLYIEKSDNDEITAAALIEFLNTTEAAQVNHLDLGTNTQGIIEQLKKLNASNPVLQARIETLLATPTVATPKKSQLSETTLQAPRTPPRPRRQDSPSAPPVSSSKLFKGRSRSASDPCTLSPGANTSTTPMLRLFSETPTSRISENPSPVR